MSVADFARFDPATNTWQALQPLPGGRSSHDAVVVGDTLYVVVVGNSAAIRVGTIMHYRSGSTIRRPPGSSYLRNRFDVGPSPWSSIAA